MSLRIQTARLIRCRVFDKLIKLVSVLREYLKCESSLYSTYSRRNTWYDETSSDDAYFVVHVFPLLKHSNAQNMIL